MYESFIWNLFKGLVKGWTWSIRIVFSAIGKFTKNYPIVGIPFILISALAVIILNIPKDAEGAFAEGCRKAESIIFDNPLCTKLYEDLHYAEHMETASKWVTDHMFTNTGATILTIIILFTALGFILACMEIFLLPVWIVWLPGFIVLQFIWCMIKKKMGIQKVKVELSSEDTNAECKSKK